MMYGGEKIKFAHRIQYSLTIIYSRKIDVDLFGIFGKLKNNC